MWQCPLKCYPGIYLGRFNHIQDRQSPKVLTRNTAIWSRVTSLVGQ